MTRRTRARVAAHALLMFGAAAVAGALRRIHDRIVPLERRAVAAFLVGGDRICEEIAPDLERGAILDVLALARVVAGGLEVPPEEFGEACADLALELESRGLFHVADFFELIAIGLSVQTAEAEA